MGRKFRTWIIFVAAMGDGAALSARADDATNSASDVLSRFRPDYDPAGIRLGTFTMHPSVASGIGSNGNVFNDATNTSDFFYSLETGVRLQSGWSRHEFGLTAKTRSIWFSNQVSENRSDWDVTAALMLDLIRGTKLSVDGTSALAHEPRGVDSVGGLAPTDAAEPTEFSSNGFRAELEQSFSRTKLTFGASQQNLDYLDTPTVDHLASINNDDRDRAVTHLFAKTSIGAWSDTAVFLRGALTSTDFLDDFDDHGLNRDSSEVVVDGGFAFSLTHVLAGEIAAGYSQKTFVDPAFAATAGTTVDVGLKWFPSMLTSFNFDASRSMEDTSVAGSAGFVSTRGGLGIDHELLRNLVLSGRVSYENDAYADIARNDDVLKGMVSGRYLINNNLHLDAGWEFTERTSSDVDFGYSASQFQLSLTGKM